MTDSQDIFDQLMKVIQDRKNGSPGESYTAKLMAGGIEKIGEKIAEEAAEVVQAAGESGQQGKEHLVHEAADLLYHLFVMLGHKDISLWEVRDELDRRFGISGLQEKASRDKRRDL